MQGKVNGAVEYCGLRLGQLKSYLGDNTVDNNACAWMSGLNVIDLKKWRELNLTDTYRRLLQAVSVSIQFQRVLSPICLSNLKDLFLIQN